ncbi:MAG: acyl-CoA dehydrogenase family protein [Deltaproteobacteria bacterium]|nr:acyl-CoA dehydrogenase family protein [Deltaproteobacteria bacterium]MBW2396103.1 acyl-CoA dehydrogenase family protein [Deltaproteobacteria bacterium]
MSHNSPLDRARELAAGIRARGDEIEEARRVPADIIDDLREAGLFRLCIPKAHGGNEAPPLETLHIIEEIARADGSTAWVLMVGSTTALLSGYFPDEWAKRIYAADPNVISAGVTAPNGRARRVDGGIEVTGQWQWGSGCHHADWLVAGSLLVDDSGELLRDGNGAPQHLLPMLTADQVEILDTWYVHGMAGSGSTDFKTEGAFVPEGRWLRFGVDRPRLKGLYQFPLLGFLGLGVCSVSLGLARRAIDEFVAMADTKVPVASSRTLAHRGYVQSSLAEAEAAVRSARALLKESVESAWTTAAAGEPLTIDHRLQLRLATTNASRQSAKAVDLMYNAAGGTSVYDRYPLGRIFRDMHVATQHIMVAPPTYELVGRVLLGLDTDVSSL